MNIPDMFNFFFSRMPFYLILYPTSRCNATCPHCYNYNRTGPASQELTLDEYEKISKNIGRIKVLTISGGEPFLRDDLADIVSLFCRYSGVKYVSFHTNAFLTDRVIEGVKKVLLQHPGVEVIVCVSIDAIAQQHDAHRGMPQGYEKLLKTIRGLKEIKREYRRLTIVSSTIFSTSTADTFSETMLHIKESVRGIKPTLSLIRGAVRDESEKCIDIERYEKFQCEFAAEPDPAVRPFSVLALKEAIERVASHLVVENFKNARQCVPCQAGRRLIVMYENGDVFACELADGGFGNIREADYDIKKLLFSAKGDRIKADIRRPGGCHCTWENILPVNILYSPRHYPAVLKEWFRLFFHAKNIASLSGHR